MDFSSATRLLVHQCWASAGIQVLNLKFSKRRISAARLGFKRWSLLSDIYGLGFKRCALWYSVNIRVENSFSQKHIRLLHCWHLPLTLDDLKWHQMVFSEYYSLKAFFWRHRIQPMDTIHWIQWVDLIQSRRLWAISSAVWYRQWYCQWNRCMELQKRSIAPARRPMIIPLSTAIWVFASSLSSAIHWPILRIAAMTTSRYEKYWKTSIKTFWKYWKTLELFSGKTH